MKKSIILLALVFALSACKGPRSGPLVKDAFSSQVQAPDQNPGVESKAHMGQVTSEKVNILVEPCDGCLTIAKLMETKQAVSGKVIKVKGSVTKFNPQIMGKNWIHLRDGTGAADTGTNDVLITTMTEAKIGDVVTISGLVRTNKDFGSGYIYKVLIEESVSQK